MKWIVSLVVGLCLIGCNSQDQTGEDVDLIDSGMSIYQLDAPWINQDGDTVHLKRPGRESSGGRHDIYQLRGGLSTDCF